MNLSAHIARHGHGPLSAHASVIDRLDSITLRADSTPGEVAQAVQALADYFRISCGCARQADARKYARHQALIIMGELRSKAGLSFDYLTISALIAG